MSDAVLQSPRVRVTEIVRAWFAAKEKAAPQLPLDDQIGRGQEAARLLAHPLVKETLASIETEYVRAWFATKDNQGDQRERIWMYLKMLHRMHGDLSNTMNNGEFIKKKLEQERESAKRNHGIA